MKSDLIWQSKLLSQFSNLSHGSTSKSFGVLRFESGVADSDVIENRNEVLKAISADEEKTFVLDQVHDNNVLVINEGQKGNIFLKEDDLPKADALVTNQPGLSLVIKSADCVPIFFYDPKNFAIGLAHAGWSGTSKNIVQEVVKTMKDEYNSESSELFMVIGPSICGQCYDISTVTDDRKDRFNRLFNDEDKVVLEKQGDKISLDLPCANKVLALKMGVLEQNIELSSICTFENNHYASYRRSPDELAKLIWSYLSLK